MLDKLPERLLRNHPQLKHIFAAMDEFKKTGIVKTRCIYCDDIIVVKGDKVENLLESNCSCGKSKNRITWVSKYRNQSETDDDDGY